MGDHGEHVAELRAELLSTQERLCPCGVPYANCADHEDHDGESREDA